MRTGRNLRWEGIQVELVGRIARLEDLLADATASAASLRELLEPISSLSRFMQELEASLEEIRGAFDYSQVAASEPQIVRIRRGVGPAAAAAAEEASPEEEEISPEPGPSVASLEEEPAEEEEISPEPGPSVASLEEEPAEEEETSPEPGPATVSAEEASAEEREGGSRPAPPPESRPGRPLLLQFESSEGYLDLMTVDRVLRENPKIADFELAEYGGKKASIKVWLSGDGEPSDEMAGESVQQVLDSLRDYASGVSIEIAEEQEED